MTLRQNAEYCKASVAVHTGDVALHYHRPYQNKYYDLEIAYVAHGRGYHITEGSKTPISAGNYVFVDYGIRHGYEVEKGDRLELINVSFDHRAIGISPSKRSLTAFAKNYSIAPISTDDSPREELIFLDTDGSIKERFLAIQREYERREPGYYGAIKGILLETVICGMRQYFCPRGKTVLCSPIVQRLLDYLSTHYMESTTLSALCREFSFSLPYVSKKFKEETGKTYTEYLHERRIGESCRMLCDSDESIETIAEYIGYSDSKKYRRKFKEIIGMSPREYRRSLLS